jgi:uncharacterized protein YodC (DUF2158 family)
MTTFKPGDVVRLRSGGPDMTVSLVDGHNVHCVWWGDAAPKSGSPQQPTNPSDKKKKSGKAAEPPTNTSEAPPSGGMLYERTFLDVLLTLSIIL